MPTFYSAPSLTFNRQLVREMGRCSRDYGCHARTVLQVAMQSGYCTEDSFTSYLQATTGEQLDRSQVAHWSSGTCHLPAEVFLHLLAHVGHPDHVLHLLQVFLGSQAYDGQAPVVSMEPLDKPGGDLVHEVLELGAALGRLQARVADALHPRGAGGARITPQERATALEEARTLSRVALHLIADLEG